MPNGQIRTKQMRRIYYTYLTGGDQTPYYRNGMLTRYNIVKREATVTITKAASSKYKSHQVQFTLAIARTYTQVASGRDYTVVIEKDVGMLYARGKNELGQLGNNKSGNDKRETTPTLIWR